MTKILYISIAKESQSCGGYFVCKRNLSLLKNIVSEVDEFYVKKSSPKNVLRSLLTGASYGMTRKEESLIMNQVRIEKYNFVFIELTIRGRITKLLAKYGVRIISFAHNMEVLLSRQRLNKEKTLASFVRHLCVSYNERLVMRYSSNIIALTERDNEGMHRIYHRKVDLIIPISVKGHKDITPITPGDYYLFVGSDFFANIEGLIWFIDNVAAKVKRDIWIVGACCNNKSLKEMSLSSNVHFKGYIDDLEFTYRNAAAVIAPILSGSGMKTKSIEALSYGKTLYGTNEAFAGIDADISRLGALCNSSEDFVRELNNPHDDYVNEYALNLFHKTYSNSTVYNDLKQYLLMQ